MVPSALIIEGVRMTRCARGLVTVFLLGGCKTSAADKDDAWDGFVVQYAEYYCDLREDCDPALFVEEFDNDAEACKKSVLTNENKGRQEKIDEGCDFDDGKADECIEAAATLTCQGWVDGELEATCDRIWECS